MADEKPSITILTVQLLSAYLSNNKVAVDGLADLVKSTRAALGQDLAKPSAEVHEPNVTPAVSVRKSLASPDHIVSLIDGKPYKTLKRHLAAHNLSPQQYRERYSLPNDYPLVAPSYSETRRAVAHKLGLGRKTVKRAAKSSDKANSPIASKTSDASATPRKGARRRLSIAIG